MNTKLLNWWTTVKERCLCGVNIRHEYTTAFCVVLDLHRAEVKSRDTPELRQQKCLVEHVGQERVSVTCDPGEQ